MPSEVDPAEALKGFLSTLVVRKIRHCNQNKGKKQRQPLYFLKKCRRINEMAKIQKGKKE